MAILLVYPAAIAFVAAVVAITLACTCSGAAPVPRDPRRARRRGVATAALFALGFVVAMPVMALVSFAGVVKRR